MSGALDAIGSAVNDVGQALIHVTEETAGKLIQNDINNVNHVANVIGHHVDQVMPYVMAGVATYFGAPPWAAGAIVNGWSAVENNQSFGGVLKGAATGAASGYLGGQAAGAAQGANFSPAVSTAIGQGVQSGVSTGLQTGSLSKGLQSGLAGAAGSYVGAGVGDYTGSAALGKGVGTFTQGELSGKGLKNSLVSGLGAGAGQFVGDQISGYLNSNTGNSAATNQFLGNLGGALTQVGIDSFGGAGAPGAAPQISPYVTGSSPAMSSGPNASFTQAPSSQIGVPASTGVAAAGTQSPQITGSGDPAHVWNMDSLREGLGG